jgi:Cof subfamily protein (haloacid dehalogenase superfamily)
MPGGAGHSGGDLPFRPIGLTRWLPEPVRAGLVVAAKPGKLEDLMQSNGIRLLLADVDGTLVTPDKALTERAIDAVRSLGKAGILFAITSGRPPRGMSMLIEPLDITTPIAAFNGGLLVNRDMSVIEQRELPEELVRPVADLIGSAGLDVWLYRGADWYVPDPNGSHVARESATVQFAPKVMTSLDGLTSDVVKLVGVSDDPDAVARATTAAHDQFGDHVTAAQSQPYYLDITHPDANKGAVARYLSARYSIAPEAIATIGDMPNDVLMFAHSGLSIAMGNASREVQRSARRVTTSNADEGFANAVHRFILP